MFEFFKDLLWSFQFPWPRAEMKKLRPLQISVCPPHRLSECDRLYEQNIPHGLPADHLGEYSRTLRKGLHLVLIAEDGENLVGTFSLTRHPGLPIVWLCYVLVNPEHHRRGIGTTMIFASLAMLPYAHGSEVLAITTLPIATSFYERLGFSRVGDEEVDGQMLRISTLPIPYGVNDDCRKWLVKAGVRLDALGSLIPTHEENAREPAVPTDRA